MERTTQTILLLLAALAVSRGMKIHNDLDINSYPDCHAAHKAGYNVSGVYRIIVNNTKLVVPCEFREGVGYTVFLQRVDHSLSFQQAWAYYEAGFGHPATNYWMGLAHIYAMTLRGASLGVTLHDWAGHAYSMTYSTFGLGARDQRYRLHIGGYAGGLPDDLSYQNGMPFSTVDAPDPNGCARNMESGWWYNYCAYTLLTGQYYPGGWYQPINYYDGIFWKDLYGYNYSLRFVSMAIRPRYV